MYKELNANPKRKKTNDCVVRSIALATNQTWYDTFDGLVAVAREMAMMPNDKRVYAKYLEKIGWKKHPAPTNINGRKLTLSQFVEQFKGTAIAGVRKHLTAIVDGEVQDTWNCTVYCVGNYWTK